MGNRNLLRQYDLPEDELHDALHDAFTNEDAGTDVDNWLQQESQLFEVNNNQFGVNVGVGAFGFATDHVGFRGDLRYFRALTDPEEDNEFDIDFGSFNFWRGTVGVTFRW